MNRNVISIWAKVFVGVTALVGFIVLPVLYHYDSHISWHTIFVIPLSTAPTTFLATIWIISLYDKDHEATEKLKRSLEWIEEISTAGEIVFYEVDLKTREVIASRLWRERWGFEEDEIVNWDEFLAKISSKFRHMFNNAFHEMMITKSYYETTTKATNFMNKDGVLTWHKFRMTPVIENDEVVKIRVANSDVTSEMVSKEDLQEALEWNNTVISNLSGAFVIHNEDFSIKYISDTMVRFCGTSDRSDIHNMSHQFLHLNEVEVEEMRESVMTQPDFVNYDDGKVYDFTCLKGKHKKVKIIRRWFNDGFGNRYMSATFTNITDLIQTQLDLEDAQAKEEEFSAHLKENMAELEEKRQQEKQMLAVIGHELRTPAAILKMMCEEMPSDIPNIEDARQTINHLIQVLDDLKSVANPQAKILHENESISMCEAMESIVQYVRPLAEGTDFTFEYTLNKRVRRKVKLSQQVLRQLMINLTKNAIKHSGGDHIQISLDNRLSGDKKTVRSVIIVSDNGRGIPVDERDTIFDPFIRGRQTTAEGTGLGLSIIRNIVEQYKGTIEYHPNPAGSGSMFVIHLELEVDESKPKYNDEYINMLDGKKILVAEDNLTIQMMTKKMLENKGAKVTIVSNGKEAVELLNHRMFFNILISDIFMPEMDGYELATTARALGFEGPIIGATAATIGDETHRMVQAGADLCLEKPLNLAKLNKMLAEYYS